MFRPIALLLTLAAIATAAPRKDAGKVPMYFAPAGTKLTYTENGSESTEVVTKVEETDGGTKVDTDRTNVGNSKSREVHLSNSDGMFILEEDGEKYEPRWCLLKFGAKDGESWSVETSRGEFGKVSIKLTLGKTERIKV